MSVWKRDMTRHEWFLGYNESTLEKLIDYGFRNQHGRTFSDRTI